LTRVPISWQVTRRASIPQKFLAVVVICGPRGHTKCAICGMPCGRRLSRVWCGSISGARRECCFLDLSLTSAARCQLLVVTMCRRWGSADMTQVLYICATAMLQQLTSILGIGDELLIWFLLSTASTKSLIGWLGISDTTEMHLLCLAGATICRHFQKGSSQISLCSVSWIVCNNLTEG
jgi:hypothetical protein